ncbi:chemosensory pili system protein ChpA (sensor histidine kinase/response regulator) [Gammaproteobacteria bacterium]
MNVSSRATERTPLSWVKGEIDQTLNRAQTALEAYAENPTAIHSLRTCSGCLHEVTGTLRIVEVQGGILLSEEMEQLVAALIAGSVDSGAAEVLMRVLLQLPDYLERLQNGGRDLPIALLPLLNELRAVRNEALLSEDLVFFPDLRAVPAFPLPAPAFGGVESIARRARSLFQSGLAAWYRNSEDREALRRLGQAMDQLRATATQPETTRLWWVGAGLIEAVQDKGVDVAPARALLGKLERQIKRLIDKGEDGIVLDLPAPLIRQILYHIARSRSHGALVEELQESFRLDEALPNESDLAAIRDSLRGANRAVMATVSIALHEDLTGVMDSLDLFVRRRDHKLANLQPLIERIRQIAGTLAVIDQEVARSELLVVSETLTRLIAGGQTQAVVDDALLSLAGRLVQVESTLASLGGVSPSSGEGAPPSFSIDDRHLHQAVIKQSLTSLARAKEAIATFVQNPTPEGLEGAQVALNEVSGGLTILELDRPSHLATACAQVLKSLSLASSSDQRDIGETHDRLAEAIAALEFYLEEQVRSLSGESFLAQGEAALAALPSLVVVPSPLPSVEQAPLVEEAVVSSVVEWESPQPLPCAVEVALEDAIENIDLSASFPYADLPSLWEGLEESIDLSISTLESSQHSLVTEEEKAVEDMELIPLAPPSDLSRSWEGDEWEIPSLLNEESPPLATPPPSFVADSTPQKSTVDDEILEVFAEETTEEMTVLDRHLPRLRAALSSSEGFGGRENEESLRTVRRSFHTLKGSGRMVGATRLGELAWAVENLFNRVIDGTVATSPDLLDVAEDARSILPDLVEDFRTGRSTAKGVEDIAEHAWRLAHAGPAAPEKLLLETGEFVTPPEHAPPDYLTVVTEEEIHLEEDADEEITLVADDAPSALELPTDDTVTHQEEEEHPAEGSTTSSALPMLDPMLLDLFNTETEGHLAVVEATLAACRGTGTCTISDSLLRALHTLQGSARMAQIDGVAVLGRALEHYVKARAAAFLPLNEPCFQRIDAGVLLIRSWLSALAGIGPIPDINSWLVEIDAAKVVHSPQSPPSVKPAESQESIESPETVATEGVIQLFLEEAVETLKTGESVVSKWLVQPTEVTALQPLRPIVNALGSGAELAGIPAIATLCRALHDIIDRAVAEPALRCEATVQIFSEAIERLWVMLEVVRDYQPIAPPDDLCTALAGLIQATHSPSDVQEQPAIPTVVIVPEVVPPPVSLSSVVPPTPLPPVARGEPERSDLMVMFLTESEDLMGHLDSLLQQLSITPSNALLMGDLRRILHTLKGGARMVGIQAIADLAHALESMINTVVDGHLPATQRLFDLLQVASDQLSEMLDQVREGVPVEAAMDLHRRIENLVTQQLIDLDARSIQVMSQIESSDPERRAGEADGKYREDNAPEGRERRKGTVVAPVRELSALTVEEGREGDIEVEGGSQDRRAAPHIVQEQVRVGADLLNQLVNHAAEVSITRSRVDQQLAGLRHSLHEMAQTVSRLRDQWRKLEIETEVQILHHHEESGNPDFDPLELDRYSTLQQLSRSLMESVSDLSSLHGLLTVATRDAEMLLLQQSRITKELQEGLMRTRMVPFAGLAQRLRRIVRQTAQELSVQAELRLVGADIELDRTVLDRIVAPLEHMLRNAISHGLEPPAERRSISKPETGSITITLRREGQEVVILARDDGRGLNLAAIRRKAEERGLLARGTQLADKEVMQFILEPGFSTAGQVTQISGRGVGMDVVRNEVKLLGGSLSIDSEMGRSTTFTIRLPLTLAVSKALLVYVQGDLFAIPLITIRAVLQLSHEEAKSLYEVPRPTLIRGGIDYQFIHAAALLNATSPPRHLAPGEKLPVLLFGIGDLNTALAVDSLLGAREIVVKSVGPQLGRVREISGATILGDGRVVLILDMGALIRKSVALHGALAYEAPSNRTTKVSAVSGISVLVVDDSITVRKVTARLLERHHMTVFTARDGVDAVALLQKQIPDLILMDIEMPRMDGYELATYVRGEPRLRNIPIIMITSRTGAKHRERAAQVGVNHYLGKPYQETELLEAIHHLRIRPSAPRPSLTTRESESGRPTRTKN